MLIQADCHSCACEALAEAIGPNPSFSDRLGMGEHFLGHPSMYSKCGNKRCPCAAHHDNKCTGSNEPGQEGSRY